MKKIITLVTLIFAFGQMSFGLTMPTKSQAKKDLLSKTEFINKKMKDLGAHSNLKDLKITYVKGPITMYSYESKKHYYSSFTKPDMAYYEFKTIIPAYKNGDKFSFIFTVYYDSYKYETTGYRQAYNKYVLREVVVSLDSYEGKDLTKGALINVFNEFSIENGKEFKADKYHFVKIDSINFTKTDDYSTGLGPEYKYLIDIYGVGVEFVNAGRDVIEYEIKSKADIHGVYNARVFLSKGKWLTSKYGFRFLFNDSEFTNVSEGGDLPAYKSLKQASLKTLMDGFAIEDNVPKTTYKAINDLKRLIVNRLLTEDRKDFIKGDLLTKIFESDESKKVLDEMYVFKNTAKAYYFNTTNIGFNLSANLYNKEGEEQVLKFIFYVVRRLSAEELKKIKTEEKPNKKVMKTIKIPVRGFLTAQFTVKLQNNEFVVTKSESSTRFKNYNDGRLMNHPLSEK